MTYGTIAWDTKITSRDYDLDWLLGLWQVAKKSVSQFKRVDWEGLVLEFDPPLRFEIERVGKYHQIVLPELDIYIAEEGERAALDALREELAFSWRKIAKASPDELGEGLLAVRNKLLAMAREVQR